MSRIVIPPAYKLMIISSRQRLRGRAVTGVRGAPPARDRDHTRRPAPLICLTNQVTATTGEGQEQALDNTTQ